MKKLICLILLCAGCASTAQPVPVQEPNSCRLPPPVPVSTCTDKLISLTEEELKAGFTCPSNSRLVFPSTFYRSERLLVMCQCK